MFNILGVSVELIVVVETKIWTVNVSEMLGPCYHLLVDYR